MTDYSDKLNDLTSFLEGAAKSIMGKLDQFSFKMLVNNLKSNDYEAVKETIEQLEREKKPLGIPPLYFVSKEHPIPAVRKRAEEALGVLGDRALIEKLTKGKTTEESVKALIEEFGHYRQ